MFVTHHYATLTMNLVSRKMVIKELKDRFLVRRKYGSGQFGEDVFAGVCGGISCLYRACVGRCDGHLPPYGINVPD